MTQPIQFVPDNEVPEPATPRSAMAGVAEQLRATPNTWAIIAHAGEGGVSKARCYSFASNLGSKKNYPDIEVIQRTVDGVLRIYARAIVDGGERE